MNVGVVMYGRYSILDLMKWSRLATEAGVITETEWCEINHLGNRLAFADDHRRPAIVTPDERARFAALARLVFPPRPERRQPTTAPRAAAKRSQLRSAPHPVLH